MLLLFPMAIQANDISIGLFYNSPSKAFVFTAVEGHYQVISGDSTFARLRPGQMAYFTQLGDVVQVRVNKKNICTVPEVYCQGKNAHGLARVTPVQPMKDGREYKGNIFFKPGNDRLWCVNQIDHEDYIAGVVEAEGGTTAPLEYYKSQALLCRTYALKNISKHAFEGFHLCDGVHCQAYKGYHQGHEKIKEAVLATRSLVIIDTSGAPIDAAFHSNSGGQTMNSGDIWVEQSHYLKTVNDPYSLKGNNFRWNKQIGLADWKKYLEKNGFDLSSTVPIQFVFRQPDRKKYYVVQSDSILLSRIRQDFNLRSTFFTVNVEGAIVILSGRGYGHGVGLSQEGAMEMARQGRNFKEIIHFYFSGVEIVPMEEAKAD
jgi:stage II sporulation protein D